MSQLQKYKYSRYNLWFPYSENKAYYLGYNYLKDSLIVLKKENKNQLDELLGGRRITQNFTTERLHRLEALGFLVRRGIDELEKVAGQFKGGKWTSDSLFIVIAPTTSCNFACVYCLQQGVNEVRVKPSVRQKTVERVKSMVEKGNIRAVSLNLYGGEPLLDIESCTYYIDEIRAFAINRGVEFGFSLTTNGSLFEEFALTGLVAKGFRGVQFTLDGPKDIHDRRRPYKSGRGSFDDIMNAIRKVCGLVEREKDKEIEIVIEVNFDKENIFSLGRLFDILKKEGLGEKIIISPELVLPTAYSEFSAVENHHCANNSFTYDEEIEAYKHVIDEIDKRGLKLSRTMGRFYPCTFTNINHFIIDPEGKIYKCAFMMGFDPFCIGTIQEEGFRSSFEDHEHLLSLPQCSKCTFLPICGGGCKYKSWLKHKDVKQIDCNRRLFEEVQPSLIECVNRDKIRTCINAIETAAGFGEK